MWLETARLSIRRLNEADWQDMKRIFVDFHHSAYAAYDRPLPTDDEGARDLTKRFADSGSFFTVSLRASGEMLGYVCLHGDGDSYDLGYCFHSAYHSMGYAYESTKALLEYYASECGAVRFTAGTAVDNIPSCGLLEKLGFACVSTETVSFDPAFSFQGASYVLNIKK